MIICYGRDVEHLDIFVVKCLLRKNSVKYISKENKIYSRLCIKYTALNVNSKSISITGLCIVYSYTDYLQ